LDNIDELLVSANKLIGKPAMEQKAADEIVLKLISSFIQACVDEEAIKKHRSYEAITFERDCLKENHKKSLEDEGYEEQKMVDTRMAIVFSEMSNLIEEFGPGLFFNMESIKEEVDNEA